MSQWLTINAEQLVKGYVEKKTLQGVQINVVMSPYDIPSAVRGGIDEKLKRFVIEFKYIDEEPWATKSSDQPITLRVGRHTNRIAGIEIDVQALKADAVGLNMIVPKVQEIIDDLGNQPQGRSRKGNYSVAKEVISERSEQLFESLMAVG